MVGRCKEKDGDTTSSAICICAYTDRHAEEGVAPQTPARSSISLRQFSKN